MRVEARADKERLDKIGNIHEVVLVVGLASIEPTNSSRLACQMLFSSFPTESLDIERPYGAYSITPIVRITASNVPVMVSEKTRVAFLFASPMDTERTFIPAFCPRARASRSSINETTPVSGTK